MPDRAGFAGFAYPENGSRILRQWNEQRRMERALQTRARQQLRTVGFAGAAIDRLTVSLQSWSGAINADLDSGLTVLRARARGLCANSEFGRRFLSLVAMNVVGPNGPVLQSRAMATPSTLDKAANDAIEVHWGRWCKSADIARRMSLPHLLRVIVKSVARDGEALVRVVRDRNLPYGMALQLLEADRLDESINRRLNNGNLVRLGVEIDSTLRPVAYYIKTAHPGENFYIRDRNDIERVDARDLYHLFLVERAEQVRGYTWFHAVLIRANLLHGFEEAAVIAARVGASKMGAFTRKDDGAGQPIANQLADMTDPNTGHLQMNAEPGEFLDLTGMPGVSLESWNPDYPHQNFGAFLKACFDGLASGLDVATHNLSGNMTEVNYSSARIAELAERDAWMTLQQWFIASLIEPLFRDWLASALIRGDITFEESGKALPASTFSKFANAARFQPRRWQWVDPKVEVEAAKTQIESRLASRSEIVAQQGRDFDDVIDELAQEDKRIKEAGLIPPVASAPKAAPESA